MSAEIDIFCASCLPAMMTEGAKNRVLTTSPQWFWGTMVALLSRLASQENADSSTTPVSAAVNVTDTLTTLAAATTTPRFVRVVNNSAATTILIDDGADPHFTTPSDRGIPLGPGDVWESPVPITTAVKGIAATGQSAYCTATNYTPA